MTIPAKLNEFLPGDFCAFGWDGGRRFVLEPGHDLHIARQKKTKSMRINNRYLIHFIWDKLGVPYGTRLKLPYMIMQNGIVFGEF